MWNQITFRHFLYMSRWHKIYFIAHPHVRHMASTRKWAAVSHSYCAASRFQNMRQHKRKWNFYELCSHITSSSSSWFLFSIVAAWWVLLFVGSFSYGRFYSIEFSTHFSLAQSSFHILTLNISDSCIFALFFVISDDQIPMIIVVQWTAWEVR